jgi:hypothetical protein
VLERLTIAEHTRLVDAIEARDADAVEAAMRAHLLRSDARYRRLQGGREDVSARARGRAPPRAMRSSRQAVTGAAHFSRRRAIDRRTLWFRVAPGLPRLRSWPTSTP